MPRRLVLWLLATPIAVAQVSVLTGQYDNSRSSANLQETILNTTNVNPISFGRLFADAVDGYIYAQPLYVPGVKIPGQGVHNVVYVATMHNSIYAFDADHGGAPLWKNSSLGAPAPHRYKQSLTINTVGNCTASGANPETAPIVAGASLTPEIGVLSTPVIDPQTNTLYAVTANLEGNNYCHKLHALDITTGMERPNSPVAIEATVNGADFFTISGPIVFSSARLLPDNTWAEHLQRPALT